MSEGDQVLLSLQLKHFHLQNQTSMYQPVKMPNEKTLLSLNIFLQKRQWQWGGIMS
jgi:hypothetical protein